jgi:hypothetical protein
LGGFSVTPTLARHFRVIAPDTRGHGRTAHPGGSIPYTQLADDVVGLMTATIVGFRRPGSVRAIVNHAGYDTLDPQAPSLPMMHQNLGGGPACDPGGPGRASAGLRLIGTDADHVRIGESGPRCRRAARILDDALRLR